MAVYPGSSMRSRATRLRRNLYTVVMVIVVGVVVAVGYMWVVRGRGTTAPRDSTLPASVDERTTSVSDTPARGTVGGAGPRTEPNTTASASAIPAADANDTVSALIAQAMALLNQQPPKVIEARDRLNEVLPMAGDQQRAFVKEQLAALADKWLFGKVIFTEDKLCSGYKVNPGDMLSTIGKQHNVPYEILMQINNIERPELLQAGVTIKVINGPFNARVYRSAFTMDLYLQNTYVKSFPVGLGKPGMETPTGRWRAKADGKLIQPIWTDPVTGRTYHPQDPDYPLGSRWIALEGIGGAAVGRTGFAIHGTKDPEQIGTPGSQGCIRLHNGDAVLVYNLMMPGVSLIDVVD